MIPGWLFAMLMSATGSMDADKFDPHDTTFLAWEHGGGKPDAWGCIVLGQGWFPAEAEARVWEQAERERMVASFRGEIEAAGL